MQFTSRLHNNDVILGIKTTVALRAPVILLFTAHWLAHPGQSFVRTFAKSAVRHAGVCPLSAMLCDGEIFGGKSFNSQYHGGALM